MHTMYRNNDFIYDAAVHLGECIAMPVSIESTRVESDAVLSINKHQFNVAAKAEIRSANKGIILAHLKEIEAKSKKPIIIIAKFIASEIAEEFKDKAINYLDVAGNAFIKKDDFFIYVSGQKVTKNEKTNQTRAFQETGLKLIFSLLSNPDNLQLSYRELAEKTGIAIGSVSNVVNELEDLKFILKTDTKRILKNKQELLNRWIVAYQDVLRPRLLKRRMRFTDKAKYNNWKTLLQNQNDNTILWGSEPAAALLTNYLKPAVLTIYTTKSWQECAKLFEFIPDENGDIEILNMFWNQQNDKNQYQTVPPILIYTDLINSGNDRNLETAKIILDNELQNIK
jgi:hypothetical protein